MQADTRTIPALTDEEIERLAIEYETCGFGRVDDRGFTTHGFDPDGLRAFARAILARSTVRAPVDAEPIAWRWVNPDGTVEFTTVAPELDGDLATMLALELGRKAEPLYLSAQEAAPQQGEWRPIESAPEDGQEVLLAGMAFHKHRAMWVSVGWYSENGKGWWDANTDPTDAHDGRLYPTHWQPLPPPPASLQQHDQQEGA